MGAIDVYWPEAHSSPEGMAKLSHAASRLVGVQGMRIPFDLCVEAEALGCSVKLGSIDSPPSIITTAFGDFQQLTIPKNALSEGRIPCVVKACELIRERHGDTLPVYVMIVGPLTLLGFILGIEKTLLSMITEPEHVKQALLEVTQFSTDYANIILEKSGGFLLIADPVASENLVAPEQFREFVLPAYQRLKSHVKGTIILHICGNADRLLPIIASTHFEGFSFHGPDLKPSRVKEGLGENMALFGNVPTDNPLRWGTPMDVMKESLNSLKDGVDVLAPACGVHPLTPLPNLKAMVSAVEKYNSMSLKGRLVS